MRVPSIVGAIDAILLAAALGCGPKATGQPPLTVSPTVVGTNLFFHSTASLADTIVVALFDKVDPSHAPEWRNESERLVFHQLYESVDLYPDCDTGPIAEARVSEDGFVSLQLCDDARFWDGTPVTSRDVAKTLESARTFVEGIDSIATRDNWTIDIYIGPNFKWAALMSPTLAVTKPSADVWPMGTGPYRIADGDMRDGGLMIRPAFDSRKPMIRFVDMRGVDARDMLESAYRPRIDFMLVDDPDVAEYAVRSNRFHTTELRASKTYFLLSVSRVRALETRDVPTVPDSLALAISRDALRSANARPLSANAGPRFAMLGGCNPSSGNTPVSVVPTTRRILYDATDPSARDLADRIVALAAGDPAASTDVRALCIAVPGLWSFVPDVIAVGVDTQEMATSLRNGTDFAYVVAFPLGRPENCFISRELLRMAPWLAAGRTPLYLKAIPLVMTGPYAIGAQSGTGASFALRINVVGNILIVGASRKENR